MSKITSAVIATLLAGGVCLTASPASAAELSTPSGTTTTSVKAVTTPMTPGTKAYLATLSPGERDNFMRTMVPAQEVTTVSAPAPVSSKTVNSFRGSKMPVGRVSMMAVGCWTQRWSQGIKATAGNTLYTYYTVGYWCSSGSSVTAARLADAGGETKTPGWRYEGVVRNAAGVVANQGRSYAQHKFVLGAGGIDVSSPLYCLRVKGLTTGSSTSDATCGIY